MALTSIPSRELQYVFTCPNPPTPYYVGTGANVLTKPATFDFSPLLALGSIANIKYFTFNYSVLAHDTSGFNGVQFQVVTPRGIMWPWIVGTELYASGSDFITASNARFDLATDFQDQTAAVTAVERIPANIPTIQTTLPGYDVSCYFTNSNFNFVGSITLYSTCQNYITDIDKFRFQVAAYFSSQSPLSSFPFNLYPFFKNSTLPPTVVVKNLTAWCEASSTPCGPSGPPPPPPPGDSNKGRAPSYDVSDARRHARAFIGNQTPGTAGAVKIGLASNVLPLVWDNRDSGLTANEVCLRFDRQSRGSPLLLLTENGGSIGLYKSVNEGRNFTLILAIGSGKHPALLVARDGRRLCYYVSGTSIKGKIIDASGATVKDTFTAVASGVDDDSISADEFTISQSRWGVALLYRSGGAITTVTSNDGVVFA